MDQSNKSLSGDQFEYCGRWVKKQGFRAFVHDGNGCQKLANSYTEFEELLASGLWFVKKSYIPPASKERKQKNVIQPAGK